MNKCLAKIAILSLAAFSLLIPFSKTAHAVYSDDGNSSINYGTPTVDWGVWCTSSGKARGECPHWIKGTIADFKKAWKNRRGSFTQNAYSTCTNPNINTDGYVIFVGYYGYLGDTLRLFNPVNDSISRNNKLDHSQATVGRSRNRYNFFNDKSKGGMTYQQMLNTAIKDNKTSEVKLAYFCEGMIERRTEKDYSGTYSSTGATSVKNNNTIDTKGVDSTTNTKSATASIYLKSKDNSNISTTFSLNHSLRSHVNHSSSPTYEITRNGSTIKRESTDLGAKATKEVMSHSESHDVPLGTSKRICQTISHNEKTKVVEYYVERSGKVNLEKTDYSYSGWISPSTSICAEAKHPYNYKITPSHPANNTPIVYTGEPLEVDGNVTITKNDNGLPETITPPDTGVRLIQFTLTPVAPDSVDVHGGSSNSEPCSFFRSKLSNYFGECNDVTSITGSLQPNSNKTLSGNAIIPDAPIGTKYCTALGIYRTDSGDGYNLPQNWNITGANCYTIAKKPNFQVWNGSIYTPGNIATSISRKVISSGFGDYNTASKTIFGSWDEQLAIVNGTISGFATGAALGYGGYSQNALPGGHPLTDQFLELSPLSVSNTNATFGRAQITANSTLPDLLISRFESIADNPRVNVIHSENDVLSLDHNIIDPTNTTYQSVGELPKTIIIAERGINISNNVSQIDAWLIVKNGFINTCQEFVAGKSSGNDCNNPLIINGPIFAKELKLNRTAGAGPGYQSIDPGEIFNLRPDSYLWAYARAQDFSEAYVVYSRELAPRL